MKFITDRNLSWRIWSIDENNITIIADRPVSTGGYEDIGALYLSDSIGYNNGIYLINEICKKCYGNDELGAISRSINITDIENVLDNSVWSPEDCDNEERYFVRKIYRKNVAYPSIYSAEKCSIIDGIGLKEDEGIVRSEQSVLCNTSNAYKIAKMTLSVIQTGWKNPNFTEKNFTNGNYYYLIFKDGFDKTETLNSYFLASRSVDLGEDCAEFGIFEVSLGNSVKTKTLFNSRGSGLRYWDRVRPIVEIPRKNVRINKINDGLSPETALKLESINFRKK